MSRRVVAAFVATLFALPVSTSVRAQTDAGTPAAAPTEAATAPAPAAPAAPAKLDPKKLKAPKETPELLEKGKAAYATSCLMCHGEKGQGDGPAGLALTPRPRDFTKDPFKQGNKPAEVFVSISEGVKDTLMVGWPQLSEEERWGLSYYVLSMTPKSPKARKAK